MDIWKVLAENVSQTAIIILAIWYLGKKDVSLSGCSTEEIEQKNKELNQIKELYQNQTELFQQTLQRLDEQGRQQYDVLTKMIHEIDKNTQEIREQKNLLNIYINQAGREGKNG